MLLFFHFVFILHFSNQLIETPVLSTHFPSIKKKTNETYEKENIEIVVVVVVGFGLYHVSVSIIAAFFPAFPLHIL